MSKEFSEPRGARAKCGGYKPPLTGCAPARGRAPARRAGEKVGRGREKRRRQRGTAFMILKGVGGRGVWGSSCAPIPPNHVRTFSNFGDFAFNLYFIV